MKELEIKNLGVKVDEKVILRDLSVRFPTGSFSAIIGPNGHGKSTLFNTIMGSPFYEITAGTMSFKGHKLNDMSADERSRLGIYMSFQAPVDIPGVANSDFFRSVLNAHRETKIPLFEFYKKMDGAVNSLGLEKDFIRREVNIGCSGGEKKRNEILQMLLLEPELILLDEIDSGIDVDGLQTIIKVINNQRVKNPRTTVVIISHNEKIFEFLKADIVHLMMHGRIIHSAGPELIAGVQDKGYDAYR